MRDIHKQRIIQTAIREYKESVLFGFSPSAPHAINMMEEALHMCSLQCAGYFCIRKYLKRS